MTLFHVYSECVQLTFQGLRKHPWTMLLPFAYGIIEMIAGTLLAPLGFVGGFIMGLVNAAIASSMLYFVGESVGLGRFSINELKDSFLKYLWPVVNVLFVLWVANMIVGPMLRNMPNGNALLVVIGLLMFVLLNAVPEMIYQRGTWGGLEAIGGSIQFVQEHWIEWFIPNIIAGVALVLGLPMLGNALFAAGVPYSGAVVLFLGPALLFPFMVFRGHLFKLLSNHSMRQLEMRYRAR